METYELTSNYHRTIFNVYEEYVESHVEMFDSHEGGNMHPGKRRIIGKDDLAQMGLADPISFIIKVMARERATRMIVGPYEKQVNEAYENNRDLYPVY